RSEAEPKLTAPASAETKYCTGCQTHHSRSAFLVSRFTPDGLTDSCLAAIRRTAERDRLAREKRLAELQSKLEASPATKRCRTCKAEKSFDNFAKHRLSKDGHRHDCADCVAAGRAKKRKRTTEQLQAERERRRKPHRRV